MRSQASCEKVLSKYSEYNHSAISDSVLPIDSSLRSARRVDAILVAISFAYFFLLFFSVIGDFRYTVAHFGDMQLILGKLSAIKVVAPQAFALPVLALAMLATVEKGGVHRSLFISWLAVIFLGTTYSLLLALILN